MTPTEILMHEHQVILLVLTAAEREARTIRAGGPVDAERVAKIVDFVRTFADGCHHAKEEDLYFARMVEKGFPREFGPIGVMLSEHEEGRAHMRAIDAVLASAAEGDATAAATVAEHLAAYAELLRAHIQKEDTILYPMADQAFSDADQAELLAAFERVESEEMGEGTHERYHALAHELAG